MSDERVRAVQAAGLPALRKKDRVNRGIGQKIAASVRAAGLSCASGTNFFKPAAYLIHWITIAGPSRPD